MDRKLIYVAHPYGGKVENLDEYIPIYYIDVWENMLLKRRK